VNDEEVSKYSELIDKLQKDGKGDSEDLDNIERILIKDKNLVDAYVKYLKGLDSKPRSKPKQQGTEKHQVPFVIILTIAIFSMVFGPLIILFGILRIDTTGENDWWVPLIIWVGLFGIVLPLIAKLAKRWGIKWD